MSNLTKIYRDLSYLEVPVRMVRKDFRNLRRGFSIWPLVEYSTGIFDGDFDRAIDYVCYLRDRVEESRTCLHKALEFLLN